LELTRAKNFTTYNKRLWAWQGFIKGGTGNKKMRIKYEATEIRVLCSEKIFHEALAKTASSVIPTKLKVSFNGV